VSKFLAVVTLYVWAMFLGVVFAPTFSAPSLGTTFDAIDANRIDSESSFSLLLHE